MPPHLAPSPIEMSLVLEYLGCSDPGEPSLSSSGPHAFIVNPNPGQMHFLIPSSLYREHWSLSLSVSVSVSLSLCRGIQRKDLEVPNWSGEIGFRDEYV